MQRVWRWFREFTYDDVERNSFRLPWPIWCTIDDLLALKTLEPLTEKLEGDEKVSERWLARQEVHPACDGADASKSVSEAGFTSA